MHIDITIEEGAWHAELPDIESLTQKILQKARQHPDISANLNGHANSEVSITLSGDEFIRNLNREYRGKNKPTNVLSFPLTEDGDFSTDIGLLSLGDIIMAYETVKQESQEQKKNFRDHYAHLLIHGFLHLLHYDHEENDEAENMERLEAEILGTLKISNPYEKTDETEAIM